MQRRLENEPTDVGEHDSSAHDSGGVRQLLSKFASLFTGTVVVRAAAFAASVVVIRLVGPSEFGAFSVGLTLAVLFALCVNPGMDDLLVRDIARAEERQLGWLVGDAILLRSPAIPLGLLGGLLADIFTHTGGLYLCLGIYGAGHAYLLLVGAILRGRGHVHTQAVRPCTPSPPQPRWRLATWSLCALEYARVTRGVRATGRARRAPASRSA